MAKPIVFAVDLDPLVLRVPGGECLVESAVTGAVSPRSFFFVQGLGLLTEEWFYG